jgi:hypothetical protein
MMNLASSAMSSKTVTSLSVISESFSAQMYSSLQESSQQKLALTNNIPVIDTSNCENLIRDKYNITKRLFIQKLDFSSSLNNKSLSLSNTSSDVASASSSVNFRMFNPNTGEEFNITKECESTSVNVNIPLPKNTKINTKLARKFGSSGFNILNQTDPLYKDRCITYVDTNTGLQMTIGERKNSFYPNQTSSCSQGCSFEGFDENNYLKCNCKKNKNVAADVLNSALEAFTSINFNVITCIISVNKNVYNKLM